MPITKLNGPVSSSIGLNFELVDYRDAKGELRPAYEMTRDGFTLLAMGFTGKPARAFKVDQQHCGLLRMEFHRQVQPTCPGRAILLASPVQGESLPRPP
ncbi:Rha family transcriptional regulator [Ancylobacter sp.]|uniref:Rha family transcriptional regulator n=1 Tax=Ancylobacter sp. TaxID=1872567 RepID=UPI003D09BCFB